MIQLSKPLRDFITNRYPHLTEVEIQYIFKYASIEPDKNVALYADDNTNYEATPRYIKVRTPVAIDFNISDTLPLLVDSDGIAWSIITTT